MLLPGLSRQTGTGTLAPSLLPANDTIDVVFPVHWIYPPKITVLQQGDLDCIKATLERRMVELKSEEQLPELTSEVEEKCLNATGHFAPRDAVYETPSDYDPVAINMGQLIIYRSGQDLKLTVKYYYNKIYIYDLSGSNSDANAKRCLEASSVPASFPWRNKAGLLTWD